MLFRLVLLNLLLSVAPCLIAQTEVITVRVDKVGIRGDMGEFSFLPKGQFIRSTHDRGEPGSHTLYEVAYPKESSTIIAESWAIVGAEGPRGIHLRKHTVRVQDSLIERTVRAAGNILHEETVYTLDGDGRPVQLRLMKEKIEGESRSYETVQYEYNWVGPAEVEIKSGSADAVFYNVKKKKKSLIIDKKKKRRTMARTTYSYNKEGRLSSIAQTETITKPASLIQFSYRKNGFLRGAISSPYTAKLDVKAGRYLWSTKKTDELTALPESVSGRIAETILEELVLKDRDYRLFFPRELNLF